jgi:hypothetical protein
MWVNGQSLHQVIESQPETPAVMVESKWKHDGDCKQQPKRIIVVNTQNQQAKEASD